MSQPEPEYRAVGDAEYELRFTRRALDDLGCSADTPAGDLEAVLGSTIRTDIVEEFRDQRSAAPTGTGGTLHNVGRPDIHPLHGTAGGRACTWHDVENRVCWFLGYSPTHDYALFENRAANGDLLPALRDETMLEVEREQLDFAMRVGPGLRELIRMAVGAPGVPQRGCIGALLRLEVAVIVVPIDKSLLADLFISVALPLHDDGTIPPPDWPGSDLQQRLVELALGGRHDNWDLPQRLPSEGGGNRPADLASELPIAVRNVDPALFD
ncbi:MAG: hypothetical protein ACXWA9_00875 [Acidimicrobiia bacterium]